MSLPSPHLNIRLLTRRLYYMCARRVEVNYHTSLSSFEHFYLYFSTMTSPVGVIYLARLNHTTIEHVCALLI